MHHFHRVDLLSMFLFRRGLATPITSNRRVFIIFNSLFSVPATLQRTRFLHALYLHAVNRRFLTAPRYRRVAYASLILCRMPAANFNGAIVVPVFSGQGSGSAKAHGSGMQAGDSYELESIRFVLSTGWAHDTPSM
ncbi:hypothetical protein V8B97DRAFT_209210 [Scleroderma yunnanense]